MTAFCDASTPLGMRPKPFSIMTVALDAIVSWSWKSDRGGINFLLGVKLKEKTSIVQPGLLLKIFFAIVVCSFLAFVSWECYFTKHWLVFGERAPKLEPRDWLFLIGALFAIAGWVCSSLVTLRNSIKQHTFNIFIQSRLSSPYAEVIRRINLKYFSPNSVDGSLNLTELLQPENSQDLQDIGMVLNYFEFMAIGVRYGELDEFVLRQIMRSIVTGFVAKVRPYINHSRKNNTISGQSKTFEHLLWLDERWAFKDA